VKPSSVDRALQVFKFATDGLGRDQLQAYRVEEASILERLRMALLENMSDPERLAKASVNNLAFAFRQLFDAGRLLRGESTQNLGLRASVIVQAHARPHGPSSTSDNVSLRQPDDPENPGT
jgi:hypothetical protein